MGLREAPLQDTPLPVQNTPAPAHNLGGIWPPKGWPMFSCITRASGTANSITASATGKHTVLTYQVHCLANAEYIIEVQIGALCQNGEVTMRPALSVHFAGHENWSLPQSGLFDVYAHGRKLHADRHMQLRAILAITYIISRIDKGLIPNINKTLMIYRLNDQ